jgi:hypothetical protein
MKQTELHTAMTASATADKTVQSKFIEMYKSEKQKQIECDYLNFLKEKAKQGGKDSKASKEYRTKSQRIQKATKRPEILEVIFGENPKVISLTQGKSGFEWSESEVTVETVDESVPSGTETEVIDMPQSENTKDLTMINTEYLAQYGTTETIEVEIENTIAMLKETLAFIKAKAKVA